jgi:hypothetical protein
VESGCLTELLQGGVRSLAASGLQGLGRFPLDEEFPASASGLGSDRAGAGAERKHFANPSCGDAEPLGDLLRCAFGRVDGGQNSFAKIRGICERERRPAS